LSFNILDTKSNPEIGYMRGAKFYYNSATNTGGAIRTFFDYSLLKEDVESPSIFIGNDEESSTILTSMPSYFMIYCYKLVGYTGDVQKGDTRTLNQNDQAVI